VATAQTLIDRALRLIGAVESGESPTAQESADGLVALNAMLGSWQTERLIVFAYLDSYVSLTPGDSSYTLGPSANIPLTPRPSKLENCFIRANGVDYPVQLVDQKRWFAIADKTAQSDVPDMGYYEPAIPTGTLLLYPVPTVAHQLHVVTWTPVPEFATLATAVALPAGYERALAYNLALDVAPEYQLAPAASVQLAAAEALAGIKRVNQRPMTAYTELGMMLGRAKSDIYAGGTVG
jgi:hypothetical protein